MKNTNEQYEKMLHVIRNMAKTRKLKWYFFNENKVKCDVACLDFQAFENQRIFRLTWFSMGSDFFILFGVDTCSVDLGSEEQRKRLFRSAEVLKQTLKYQI